MKLHHGNPVADCQPAVLVVIRRLICKTPMKIERTVKQETKLDRRSFCMDNGSEESELRGRGFPTSRHWGTISHAQRHTL